MGMAYLRRLSSHFDPAYIKPSNLGRAISVFRAKPLDIPFADQQPSLRRPLDRRSGIDRRSRQLPILLDTRSPHARRKQARRHDEDDQLREDVGRGIDVYA
jgi:hypothetical protein